MKNKAKTFNTAFYCSLLINDNNRFYNRGLFVCPDGQIEYYDKRHRFILSEEPQQISAGQNRKIVTYKSWKINLSICYDLRFPVWLRNTYKDGVYEYDILLNAASWPNSRGHVWRTLLQARAMENMAYVIGVNRIGEDQNHISYRGDSMLIDPRGSAIAVINPGEEAIISASLSKDHLIAFRQKFAIGQDWDRYEICN